MRGKVKNAWGKGGNAVRPEREGRQAKGKDGRKRSWEGKLFILRLPVVPKNSPGVTVMEIRSRNLHWVLAERIYR